MREYLSRNSWPRWTRQRLGPYKTRSHWRGRQERRCIAIEIKPKQATVKNSQDFSVGTTIRNTGKEDQQLEIWSCSYPEQWIVDNPIVHIMAVSCKKNTVVHVRLKPGEAYDRALSVRIEQAVRAG